MPSVNRSTGGAAWVAAPQPTPLATLPDREWIPSEVFRENYFAKVGQNPFFFSKGYSGSWLLSS